MITKKEITYSSFGRCLQISNSKVQLVVTLDFGPRIIRYSFLNGENVFFENTDKSFFDTSETLENAYGKGSKWYIYGGHRLWTAPELYPQTYYPDNFPVEYELTEFGAIFNAPIQKENGYQMSIEVILDENSSKVTVNHNITNHSNDVVSFAPWSISALAAGGTEIVPQPTIDTGFAANRHITFWSYAKLNDKRVTLLDKYILLKQDQNATNNFKFGINSQHGYAIYLNHGDVFVKKFNVNLNGNYADGGMSFETYTNPKFLEMESLGEICNLSKDETATHTENWELFKDTPPKFTDSDIDNFVKTYV